MGKIVRYITEDGSAFILAVDTTDIAARAEAICSRVRMTA